MDRLKLERRLEQLISNAERRLNCNPVKARHGLEAAERVMDRLNLEYHTTRNDYPAQDARIQMAYDYLNR
ncbi:hypothetical protein JW930_01995 [Candidatus Woesearchaeota archaeon]|nr:hypothetical protein [Candidatus Woesearchaeota archaeon]